jgi:pimeloyl-ACP methyl ester carboxylesterase/DNA-binding CsgD family transcriptional regulator
MTAPKEDPPRPDVAAMADLTDQVIDDLYEVAVDPTRYEALLDHWEAMIAPQREAANDTATPALRLPEFESHFQRADRMLAQVTGPGQPQDPAHLLARIDRSAAFVIDQSLIVTRINAAAALALGVTQGARLADLALGDGEAEELARQTERLLRANSAEPIILRVRTRRDDRIMLVHLRAVRPEAGPAFVIAVTSELGWPAGFTKLLRSAFDLTPAEGKVVRALAEGAGLAEIARDRGRSIETVRAQIKAILSKTGTRSQAELIRLTLSTMEMAQYTGSVSDRVPDASTGFGTLAEVPFRTLMLPDGRRHDYIILGDPEGRPCLFLPLDYGLVRWPASAEDEALRRGLRIIVPVRPGYGHSTPLRRGTPYVAQLVEDTVALLDHLGVGRVPVLSLGGDSYLTMALHATYPERVAAMICCAGVLPLSLPAQYDRMDKWHRFILAGARYTPHLLPFLVKAGFALANRVGKRAFVHAVYGKSAADVATFEIPEVFEAMVCGSEVALSDRHSAHDAFSREIIAHETRTGRPNWPPCRWPPAPNRAAPAMSPSPSSTACKTRRSRPRRWPSIAATIRGSTFASIPMPGSCCSFSSGGT